MYQVYNPNPCGKLVGDCVIRALSILLDKSWNDTYTELCMVGLRMCDMPSSNVVWNKYLMENGYAKIIVDDITVEDFCERYPDGKYLLATGSHVITVIDGTYYDAWDSGKEIIIYYYTKEKEVK